ncbi:GDSL-type esterase/lipase family protein [Marinimicrobium sp. ABcell2]|uniref:GDSL-type esterase/lipase family protein n=1 Tax=Marinimicrobium sp. ABcell2 TaxID=3069751 RepID=UPI0027B51151|nr:GDSL-type esterase/lipase family protein [Marinimicrobium sp. ABcell2]MDQ2077694.1 GDSL-type esterase/lipase family protein [Marinimicrobium sp. ABcell2]
MIFTRTLLLSLIMVTALAACSSHKPASIDPQPRLQEYEWMSIERWQSMHAAHTDIARTEDVELLLLGDSITEGWPEALLEEYLGAYRIANFGIGGDRTENVLWRLENGAVGQLQPRAVSLLIGVNNFGLADHPAEDVYLGVSALVEKLLDVFPTADILVHTIFPYQESPEHPDRARLERTNAMIRGLADRERVHLLDIGAQLVDDQGHISPDIMPDYLHLSEAGYRIWAEHLTPALVPLLHEPR